jgi:dethiobiotin synthetase
MSQGYFISGTDTAVGKTLVATTLLKLAATKGLSTLGLKPVAAGCAEIDGTWMNDDARELMLASSIRPDYATVNPLALREAMAPHIAAARAGVAIDTAALIEHCRSQLGKADLTVIEGAGGWQVPLTDTSGMDDLAVAIGLPVILVVGVRLGCINHSLLTAAAIQARGLRLAGWVANLIEPAMPVAAENIATLEARLPCPLLGQIPWLNNPDDALEFIKLP